MPSFISFGSVVSEEMSFKQEAQMSLNRSPENLLANGNTFKSISTSNSEKFGQGFPIAISNRIFHDLQKAENVCLI